MARKRKTLPKDFEALLQGGDLDALRAVFEACETDARGGLLRQVALAFDECPDTLSRWLVAERGADLEAPDHYGDTPLQTRARSWRGGLDGLLALGPNLRAGENGRGTPLHRAAGSGRTENARRLLAHGAPVDALDARGHAPLAHALAQATNSRLAETAELAALLLDAGASITPDLPARVTRLGEAFEFHRAGMAADARNAGEAALARLYALFDVSPVPPRARHDGRSPIHAPPGPWRARHRALWDWLVPSSGAAATVQGEVVRVSGRLADEFNRNGGANWDADFRRMATAWLDHIASGAPLPPAELAEARARVAALRRDDDASARLCELAVAWVDRNPVPVPLPAPAYRR